MPPTINNPHRALNNATTWNLLIWESDLGTHAKMVACYLRTHMNDYQEIAFPSVGRIARYCAISENTARKALRQLCAGGYLAETGQHPKYQTKIYSIRTPSGGEPLQEVSHTPSGGEPELTNELTNTLFKGIPPDREAVVKYCIERGNGIDVDVFMDFYESKGWLIGKNKMKDWKAAVRTWEKRNEKATESNRGKAGSDKNQRRLSPGDRTRQLREQRRHTP
jgi:hypothetical protein